MEELSLPELPRSDDDAAAAALESEKAIRGVQLLMAEQIAELCKHLGEHDLTGLVQEVIDKKNRRNQLPKGVPAEMIRLLEGAIKKVPAKANEAEAVQARRYAAIQFLVDVLNNEFKDPGKRWAANLTNVGLRTGIVVTACILVRESLAFVLAKNTALGEDDAGWWAGVSLLSMTLATNIIYGALDFYRRDKKDKLGSTYSIVMRLGMCLLAMAALLGCHATGTLGTFVSRSSSLITYCYARDFCNLFLRLSNNVATLPKKGVMASGTVYGLIEFLASFLPDQVAPLAGAAGLPKPGPGLDGWHRNITLEDVAAAGINLPQTYFKALDNALADAADDVIAPAIFKHMETPTLLAQSEAAHFDEIRYATFEKILGDWAKELLLLKSDEKRKEDIAKYSFVLYGFLTSHLKEKEKKFKKLSDKDRALVQKLPDGRDLKPDSNLPPASELVFGPRNLPDFSTYKKTLDSTLKAVAKQIKQDAKVEVPPAILESVARQIYIDSFIDAYMPLPSSEVQLELRKAMLLQDPAMLPDVLRVLVAKQVKAERAKLQTQIKDGLRLKLSVANPLKDADFVNRCIVEHGTTNAARITFYTIVFGAVYALSDQISKTLKSMPDLQNEPVIQSVLEALVVMSAVIVGYQFFYGMHDRAPAADGRQPFPGGDGARELPVVNQGDITRAIQDHSETVSKLLEGDPDHSAPSRSGNPSGGSSS